MASPPMSRTPTAPSAPDERALDRSLLHGIAWTSGAKWASQICTWASTLIVARLLTPEDYGLVGMASIYLGLITLLSEFGLGSAVITLRELSEEQVAQINATSPLRTTTLVITGNVLNGPQGAPGAVNNTNNDDFTNKSVLDDDVVHRQFRGTCRL